MSEFLVTCSVVSEPDLYKKMILHPPAHSPPGDVDESEDKNVLVFTDDGQLWTFKGSECQTYFVSISSLVVRPANPS